MDKYFFVLAVCVILFVGSNVLDYLGLSGSSLQRVINPSFYFLIASFFLKPSRKFRLGAFYAGLFITFFIFVFYCVLIDKRSSFMSFPINNLLIPALFCFLFPENDWKIRKYCFLLIIVSYVVTCFMAITERVLLYHFFPLVSENAPVFQETMARQFRSTALHNHPLTNAFFLTIILLFLLVSRIKQSYKLFFFVLGYIAILCFNTRTSIIMWPLLYGIVFLRELAIKRGNSNFFIVSLSPAVMFCLIAILIQDFDFGSRFFGGDALMDDSAMVRVGVWEMFTNQKLVNLFFSFGMSVEEIQTIMRQYGISIIENSFVVFSFNMGGIGLLMTIFSYTAVFKHFMRGYTKFQVCFIIGAFLILGNTNNGIGCYTICTLLIVSMVFPINKNVRFEDKIINRMFEKRCQKYLSK